MGVKDTTLELRFRGFAVPRDVLPPEFQRVPVDECDDAQRDERILEGEPREVRVREWDAAAGERGEEHGAVADHALLITMCAIFLVPIAFLAMCAYMLWSSIDYIRNPDFGPKFGDMVLAGIVIMGAGIPLYLFARR